MTPQRLFVCGMLRSGTSLIQTLLTNHPEMLVAYQPFNQLYVEAKRLFLEEHGIQRMLPLDDGDPANGVERKDFLSWLSSRHFSVDEANALARDATSGKGGGLASWQPSAVPAGSFLDIHTGLHDAMAGHLGRSSSRVLGSKEILCEEYVPALLEAGVRCVLIIRDPRGVIASANHGRYRETVGDRYPLMMLIRLWRKSAAYWLQYRDHPLVRTIRYEDLAAEPSATLTPLAHWLGMGPFPQDVFESQLRDHAGQPWQGNSSFGEKPQVDAGSRTAWRDLLDPQEQRFIAACTKAELEAVDYPIDTDVDPQQILDFREDTRGVRESYLQLHPTDATTLREEADRLQLFGHSPVFDDEQARRYFLFPEALASAHRMTSRTP